MFRRLLLYRLFVSKLLVSCVDVNNEIFVPWFCCWHCANENHQDKMSPRVQVGWSALVTLVTGPRVACQKYTHYTQGSWETGCTWTIHCDSTTDWLQIRIQLSFRLEKRTMIWFSRVCSRILLVWSAKLVTNWYRAGYMSITKGPILISISYGLYKHTLSPLLKPLMVPLLHHLAAISSYLLE